MGRRLAISILALFISVVLAASGFGARRPRKYLLREGFALAGVDGKLIRQDSNTVPEVWFFELDSDVSDDRARVRAGTRLLLPSSTLEKMTIDAENRLGENYKLWARVTKYRGRNFIFPIYFLPLGKTSKPQPPTSQKPQQQTKQPRSIKAPKSVTTKDTQKESDSGKDEKTEQEPAIYDLDDALPIPKEMMEKLRKKSAIPVKRIDTGTAKPVTIIPPKRTPARRDYVLADRTGFLIKQHKGLPMFAFDALGRNIQQRSLQLLPCEVLHRAERRQFVEADPLRFKVAGLVTKYKGRDYLLLERALRVHSHGSFGR
jgi:hypothetical protein